MDTKRQHESSGKFVGKDKFGELVILEWKIRNVLSPDFHEIMKSISDMGSEAFAEVETEFLKKHPDAREGHLEKFESFFEDGVDKVDWKKVKEKMHLIMKQIFEMDHSKFSADDTYCFIKAKDKETKELLGFTTFFISPKYPPNTIKAISTVVAPTKRRRGLAKLLRSSILRIFPKTKRIFLMTRITNERAIKAYSAMGFTKDPDPIMPEYKFNADHWIHLEYRTEKSNILQETAKTITPIKAP